MKKMTVALLLVVMGQSAFALEATSKTTVSLAAEVAFSAAITSVTSEISSFSISDTQKQEARKILADVQNYNQTGHISIFLNEKISILKELDRSLSIDESVDILINASETILSK